MKIERNCPVCSKPYQADLERLKFGRQTTCSRACSYLFRGAKRRNAETMVCAVCRNEFTRTLSKIKSKHGGNFCSRSCHYAGRSQGLSKRIVTRKYHLTEAGREGQRVGRLKTVALRRERGNYGHSDATRARMSETTAKAIASGKIPKVSKLEDKVATELARLGQRFERQYVIRDGNGRFACSFDFYFPDMKIALEVNGTFWHCDPRVYPQGPTSPVQLRNQAAWERKLALASERGIPILVVWERDIKQDAAEAVRTACEAVYR